MPDLHRIDIVVPEDDFDLGQALVARHAVYGWEEESLPTGEIRLRAHAEQKEILEALAKDIRELLPEAAIAFSVVPSQDWTEAWREFFTPVEAGTFLILPPWLADTPGNGLTPILIEPKSAFGTGHHPTTTLCLQAISHLRAAEAIHPGGSFLDLGTGTGILGMACVTMGMSGLGLDIDPLAVSNARENRALNHIGEEFHVEAGSVDAATGKTFDLVIANILAGPLVDMAVPIMDAVRPGGSLILSGFLAVQAPNLEKAYAAMGPAERLTEASTVTRREACADGVHEEWVCLYWKAKP